MKTNIFDTKQRFGFRKHRWAKSLASVLLGLSFVGVGSVVTGTNTVHADELGKADQAKASLQEARDKVNSGSNTQTLGLNKVPNSGLRVQRFAAKPVTNDQDIEIDYDSDGNPIIPSQPGHPGDNYNYNVNYGADEHNTTIHYKDAPDHEVDHKDVSGYTGQTVRPGTSDSNTGADDKNATYNSNLPDGWKLKDGQKLPDISFSGNPTGVNDAGQSDNSHNAQDEAGYNVSIEHNSGKLDHTKPGQDIPKPGDTIPGSKGNRFKEDPNNPGKVAGLTDKDLDKTISETIDIDVPEGYPKPASKTDSVQFSRGATVDSVDGHVIEYGAWVASDGKNGKLADQTIDGIAGYVINVDGKAVGAGEGAAYTIVESTVTGADGNIHHTVTYVAQGKVKTVDIVDKTDGSQDHSFDLSGNTDQTVKPSDSDMNLVDGLEFASDADRDAYNNLKSNGYKLTANDTSQATNNHIVINVQHHKITISTDKDIPKDATNRDGGTTKNITRTITVKIPNHDERTTTDKTDTQTVTFTRTGTYDAVTKKIAWNAYTSAHPQFDKYDITAIPGYNVSVPKGDASELASDGSKLNAKTITSDAQNEALTVEYTGTAHTIDYSFVDDKDGRKEVGHAQAGGKTDQTIDLTKVDGFKIPAGYRAIENQIVPSTVKMSMDNPDLGKTVVIHLTHDTRTITPGKDITPGQTIPGDHHNSGDTDPKDPINYNYVHKSMTRNVTITEPGQADKTDNETITFERTAKVDLVDGSVSYTDWAPVNGSASGFNKVDYKTAIDGYTTNYNGAQASDLDAKTPTQAEITAWTDSDNKTIHVTYDAQGAHQDFRFVSYADDTKYQVVNMDGSVNNDKSAISISKPGQDGKTGGSYDAPNVPDGWVFSNETEAAKLKGGTLVPQDQMKVIEVHVVHGKTTIKPGDLPNSGDTKPGDHSKPGDDKPNRAISYDDLHKELDRTITVKDPHTGANSTTNKISFERTATIDTVTGEVSFGDWTPVDPAKNSFAEFDVPVVDGYTPSVAKVDGKTFTTNDDVDHWSDPKVQINYTANDAHQTFHYTDDQGQPVTDGKGQTIADKTVNGKTDGQITKPDMPGFVIDKVTKDGKDVTSDYKNGTLTFDPEDMTTPITVTVSHDKEVIKPGDTTPDPKNPDNKGKDKGTDVPGGGKTDKGTQYNDLHKTITEVVNETLPGQSQKELSRQTIDFERDATIDKVTGEVTYGDWHVADSSARKSFEVVNATGKDGYTPSVSSVAVPATDNVSVENWKADAHVTNITYTANEAHKNFKFVDGKGNVIDMDGHNIKNPTEDTVSTTVNGHTDETFKAPGLPKGWKLVKDEQGPTGGKFTPGEQDTQTITIEHDTLTVDPTNPNHYKNGDVIPGSTDNSKFYGIDNKLNSKATRKIVFHWPNGKVPTTLPEGFHLDEHSTDTVTQTITFFRKAQFDLVTGELTYLGMDDQPAHDGNDNEPWDSDPKSAKFPALVIPKVAGYKAKVSLVQNKRTVDKHGLARMNQLFAVNFMALPASVPGDHIIGHEPVDPTKGDDGHKVAPKPGDTIITDDKGGTRVIPGDTDPNKGQDHGTTSPDNPNKGKDEGNKGQDHGSTNPDKPNKGKDEGNKGKDEGSTTPVVPTTPSDSSNGQTLVQTPDQKPEDSDKPVDNGNNKGQGDKQDQNDQTENTKKTSKKTPKKNKKSAKDVNKVTREAKEKQREEMRKHPSSTGVGSNDGVLGSPLMGNKGPVAPTQDQAHMAPEGSPSATVQAATLGTHAVVSNSNNLPQTGETASKLGLIGLAFASLGGIVALAGTRKRREN